MKWTSIFSTVIGLACPSSAGIHGFSKWFGSVFHRSIKTIEPDQWDEFDHVCFDMNQILHVKLKGSRDAEHVISRTFFEINEVLKVLKPCKSVVFAFDGSAPLAKLLTQRARRGTGRRDDRYKFSPLHITPGTEFMSVMAEAMRYYAYCRLPGGKPYSYKIGDKVWVRSGKNRFSKYEGPWLIKAFKPGECLILSRVSNFRLRVPSETRTVNLKSVVPYRGGSPPGPQGVRERVRYYISGGDIPGEGELKILDWAHLVVKEKKEESIVIVGGDADLVLQGLALNKVKNLFVYSSGLKRSGRLISIWEVIRQLDEMFPGESNGVRNDLLFLLLLNGNDYLPKVRGMSFEGGFRHYCAAKKTTVGKGKFLFDSVNRRFNWEFLLEFLKFACMESEPPPAEESAKTLAMVGPTAAQWINVAAQRKQLGKDKVEYKMFKTDVLGEGMSPLQVLWGVNVHVGTYTFTIPSVYATQKEARQAGALKALQNLLPEQYEEFLLAREVHQEKVRIAELRELAKPQYDSDESDSDDYDSDPCTFSGRAGYSVEEYLRGILWTVQMYHDGFSPDYYWRYGHKYAPSCSEMAQWIAERELFKAKSNHTRNREKGGALAAMDVMAPFSSRPALPSDIACLAMMNLRGRSLVPEYLRGIMDRESPVGDMYTEPEVAQENLSNGSNLKAEFDIDQLLKAVEDFCPEALHNYRKGRHEMYWTVVQHASLDTPSTCKLQHMPPPLPPVEGFSEVTGDHVKTLKMPATISSPCRPWVRETKKELSIEPSSSLLQKNFKTPFLRPVNIRPPVLRR